MRRAAAGRLCAELRRGYGDARTGGCQAVAEGGGELADRTVHELTEVGLVGFEPLFVSRDRHAEGDVADGPRRQRVGALADALATNSSMTWRQAA